MMRLRHDRSGLESLPLKLMIVAVVASLSIIPASEALDSLRVRDFARKAELQLDLVIGTAQVVGIEGPGSVRTLDLDLDGGTRMRFASLSIGDHRGGANMSSVVLRFVGGGLTVRSASNPPVWMTGLDGESLVIDTPRFKLTLSCVLDNRTCSILLEVA
jgi:hypothetical protein